MDIGLIGPLNCGRGMYIMPQSLVALVSLSANKASTSLKNKEFARPKPHGTANPYVECQRFSVD